MNADTAWQEYLAASPNLRDDMKDAMSHSFMAGYRRALQDAADEWQAQCEMAGSLQFPPWTIADLRDRAVGVTGDTGGNDQ